LPISRPRQRSLEIIVAAAHAREQLGKLRENMSDSERNDIFRIATDEEPEVLRTRLEAWGPWRMEVLFSNGIKTSDFPTFEPFNRYPLTKARLFERKCNVFAEKTGGRALDVGFNVGHNSLFLAKEYGMQVTGIDESERHQQVARYFAKCEGINIDFKVADANFFKAEEAFDLVLHFGTLYHLPHPLLALDNAFASLKPGGILALETQTYEHADDPRLCKFFNSDRDLTNYWALSPDTLRAYMGLTGFVGFEIVNVWENERLARNGMARTCLIARKPG
jgi:SAM-dependent methyltransferase